MNNRFVFVTPAFNCQEKILNTVKSVYAQSYDNWRMVVYDDMSTDNTAQIVEDFSRKLGLGDKLKVVSRNEKHGEVRNTLDAVKSIDQNEIVCRLDGGDWLVDNDGLVVLDSVYENTQTHVAWTAHRWSYTSQNISGPLDLNKSVYEQPWVSSHLKTFRKKAIDNIDEKNFKDDEGNYIMIACDQAIFLPMIHNTLMQGKNCVFVPFTMYHYDINLADPNLFKTDRALKQKYSAEWIRSRGFIENGK
jgi:glycosyltransferase involved in cell wall biosynthesis